MAARERAAFARSLEGVRGLSASFGAEGLVAENQVAEGLATSYIACFARLVAGLLVPFLARFLGRHVRDSHEDEGLVGVARRRRGGAAAGQRE
jgi:hypothetical protein